MTAVPDYESSRKDPTWIGGLKFWVEYVVQLG